MVVGSGFDVRWARRACRPVEGERGGGDILAVGFTKEACLFRSRSAAARVREEGRESYIEKRKILFFHKIWEWIAAATLYMINTFRL